MISFEPATMRNIYQTLVLLLLQNLVGIVAATGILKLFHWLATQPNDCRTCHGF